ncbi:violacein biosynthesis enzyme VioE [Paludibacterium purpuratum]|uniref:Violacein biosynthesis enzyme VioE n=1 Tax=Paludibacterium purpuratum TaxID=1144873 RepID=A0A4V3DVK8_9NEIS|nr:violacein biosynthesis enzyme VioE [Paludibacterium purpuratum]TDR81379.1 violacein biosynthesis enzyme VioE [Paludibacterium purpuratum]
MTRIPPLLPQQWSSAYISYWSPMMPEDQISSGYCWFDYTRNLCRIDGLFNPWSERTTGYRLWMSETGNASARRTHKQKVAYGRDGVELSAQPLAEESALFEQLYLPQGVLREHRARHDGRHEVLGLVADAWTYQRPGKGPATLFLKADTDLLLRMVTGDADGHASVRDFPNLCTRSIPAWIFAADAAGRSDFA